MPIREKVLSALKSFRYIMPTIFDNSSLVERDLASLKPTKYMVYPCDIIDLRKILKHRVIEGGEYVSIFSIRFAEKYFKQYPLFVVVNAAKLENKDKNHYGGMTIFNDNSLSINKAIYRLVINDPVHDSVKENINKIIKDVGIQIEIIVSNSIPGVSSCNTKLAQGVSSEIELTPKENNIFNFLRTVKKDMHLNIQMRVAGGWVRDKLLGRESDDIDIAVDMPGYDFAKIIADASVRYNINHVPKAYKVSLDKSADPNAKEPDDKLMVGAIDLFGQKIEFVPMRTEHYPDPNSRQPAITTTNDPQEDVRRRDLTINALYYNIDTGKIDDFVGGIADLGLSGGPMKLRTPDEPHKTFEEDPLRLLRVLRFHSRYPESEIDPSIIQSMSDPAIQESYTKKVATERAGPEIMKMMLGQDPVDSLRLLFDSGLYKTVFNVPDMEGISPDGIHMDQRTPHHKYNLLDHTLKVVGHLNKIMTDNKETDKMRGLMNLAALFHDFGKMKVSEQTPHPKNPEQIQYIDHEKDSQKMADAILKSIGVGGDDRDIVNQVVRLHMQPHAVGSWGPRGRGRFLRKTRMHGKEEEHKDLWKYIMYHAQADEMSSQPDNYDPEYSQLMFDKFREYAESPQGRMQSSLVDGHDIMVLIPELEPKTGFIREVSNAVQEMQDVGTIDMSYLQMPEGPAKETAMNQAKDQAHEQILIMKPEIIRKYQEKMAMNWYDKFKKAQTVPLSSHGEPQISPDRDGIKKGPPRAIFPYQVGMRVRDRRRGVALPQDYGIIKSIDDGKVSIEWHGGHKKKSIITNYDIDDTVALSAIVAEV